MNDTQCVADALKAEGITAEVGQSLELKGWGSQKSHVQVRIPKGSKAGNRYDAGFVKDAAGNLSLVKESMDYALNKDWMNKVKQQYTRQQALKLARAKGLKLAREVRVGNKIQMVFNQ